MTIKTDLHEIQMKIIIGLMTKEKLRFSELNQDGISTDLFSFHLRELLKNDLIEKNEEYYKLTTSGKEYGNRLDTDRKVYEKQAKVCVLLTPMNGNKILMQQRLKHPYFGFFGLVGGKVKYGESIFETAKRELLEETGLEGKVDLMLIEHKTDCGTEGQVLEDKFFYIFKATKLKGKLIKEFEHGKNVWVEKSKVKDLENLFDDVLQIFSLIEKEEFKFVENKFSVKGF